MGEKIQAITREAATTNLRWQVFVVVACASILEEVLPQWLPKPWAKSLAWSAPSGLFLIVIYSTRPELRTHRRSLLLILMLMLGGAVGVYFSSLHPAPQYPLWVSGVFWGVVTSLAARAYAKRRQGRRAS